MRLCEIYANYFLLKGDYMKLFDLLSKPIDSDKATLNEIAELEKISGKKLPDELPEVLGTFDGIKTAAWILYKRKNPKIKLEDMPIPLGNEAEIGWECMYAFSRFDRSQIELLKKTSAKAVEEAEKNE